MASSPERPDPIPLKQPSLLAWSGVFLLGHVLLLAVGAWLIVRFALDVPLTRLLAAAVTTTGAEWIMYLLIALSVVSSGLTLERLRFYARRRIEFDATRQRLTELLAEGRHDDALRLVESLEGMEGRVTAACLRCFDQGPAAMEEEMMGALANERLAYDKNLVVLGTLGNNAPFIGLFGTVLGIIKAFVDLAADLTGGAEVVMSGISEALIATGVGLLVAIPSVIAYNALKGRVKVVVTHTETLARTVMRFAKAR